MEQPKPKFEFRNRLQVYLGPVDIEALIEAGHPARAIWALLESLDFSGFEEQILSREGQAGRAAVPPRLLAALWIYGYSLGVGSARALERMQAHEPGLRWLCADEAVNHHTLVGLPGAARTGARRAVLRCWRRWSRAGCWI
jgi:transposase